MKKILTSILFLLFFTSNAIADIPPLFQAPWDKIYYIRRNVVITNLNEFPDLVFFASDAISNSPPHFTPNPDQIEYSTPKEVKNNENITGNILISLKKGTLEKNGGIDGIDWKKTLSGKKSMSLSLSGTIKGNSALSERLYKYKIKATDQNNVTLQLIEVTLKYNNGTPDKVIPF